MAWGLLATINWIQCRHQVFLFVCLFVLWRFWYFKCISEILLMQSRSNFFGIQAWELHESKNQFYMILRTVGHGSRSVSWRFFWEPLVKNCPYIYIYIYTLPLTHGSFFDFPKREPSNMSRVFSIQSKLHFPLKCWYVFDGLNYQTLEVLDEKCFFLREKLWSYVDGIEVW
jgi:hypothetical protein